MACEEDCEERDEPAREEAADAADILSYTAEQCLAEARGALTDAMRLWKQEAGELSGWKENLASLKQRLDKAALATKPAGGSDGVSSAGSPALAGA